MYYILSICIISGIVKHILNHKKENIKVNNNNNQEEKETK